MQTYDELAHVWWQTPSRFGRFSWLLRGKQAEHSMLLKVISFAGKRALCGVRWDEEEESTGGIEPVRSKTHRGRVWPFFSALSLYKKPRHAWLTHPGSDADRETATFPSFLLLLSMACVLRQHELVTDV